MGVDVKGNPGTFVRRVKTFPGGERREVAVPNGGSCRATIIGGVGRDERLLMRERNTSQLPRLLCCTMERERATPAEGDGGGEDWLDDINGPSPDHLGGQERGWGPPGEVDQQRLE